MTESSIDPLSSKKELLDYCFRADLPLLALRGGWKRYTEPVARGLGSR